MMTAQHPKVFTARRASIVGMILLGFISTMVLNSGSSEVEAAGLFGGLRAPGDAAFIAAHRGDRSVAPENTMPAMLAALDGPMDFIETDVQLTQDSVPVLMHDSFVNRTTNGSGRVSDFSLAELQSLDAGSWYSPSFARTHVPTLESLLAALQTHAAAGKDKKALIELKGYWTKDEADIVTDLIAQYRVSDLIIMTSFDTSTIDHIHAADSSLPLAIITATLPPDPVRFAGLYGAIALITNYKAVASDPWSVNRMHRAGVGIIVYTLNTKAAWQKALDLGVDGIITDRPERLGKWLASATEK